MQQPVLWAAVVQQTDCTNIYTVLKHQSVFTLYADTVCMLKHTDILTHHSISARIIAWGAVCHQFLTHYFLKVHQIIFAPLYFLIFVTQSCLYTLSFHTTFNNQLCYIWYCAFWEIESFNFSWLFFIYNICILYTIHLYHIYISDTIST